MGQAARRAGDSCSLLSRRGGISSRRAAVGSVHAGQTPPAFGLVSKRRAEEPGVPVAQLLREIRERCYLGSSNLLVRYINQDRAEADQPHLSPRRAARILLTSPDRLRAGHHETLAESTAACPEMTA